MINRKNIRELAVVPPAVVAYLSDVADVCSGSFDSVVSLVAFGSAITGSYETNTSDVDLLVVLADTAGEIERERVRNGVAALEDRHGLVKHRPSGHGRVALALKRFADRTSDNDRSFFVCSRADLLSGEPRRILNLPWPQAVLADGVVVPSMLASAITIWGEDILDDVSCHAIGRVDVAKSCFALSTASLFAAAAYVVFPDVTKYAMDTLKRSIHNCFYCHNGRLAHLRLEVSYFESQYGSRAAFAELLSLRQQYRPSFRFVVRCVSTVLELHLRTALDLRFPRKVRPRRWASGAS